MRSDSFQTIQKFAEKSFYPRIIKKENGCHEWQGTLNKQGYGVLGCSMFGTWLAHRLAWKLHFDRLPKGGEEVSAVCVLHKCDNPCCVNPAHLFLGTRADNIADAKSKGRHGTGDKKARKGETHGMCVLTAAKVRRIREFVTVGISQSELARFYNTTQANIFRIKERITWKHI